MRLVATAAVLTVLFAAPLARGEPSYVVRKGETLLSIARNHRVSVRTIARANHLKETAQPTVGQTLIIPEGDAPGGDHAAEHGTIRAERYGEKVRIRVRDAHGHIADSALKAFQNLAAFREDSQFSTWLIRITVNQSLMKLRKQRANREVSLDGNFESDEDTLPADMPDRAPNPEQLCWASELRDILCRIVKELRPLLRTVFILR